MAFDLSQESSQTAYGPVPAGSEVMLQLELMEPNQAIPEHKFVRAASTGLLQIYAKFTVQHGSYSGVSFRQNINLPAHVQRIQLTAGQTKACNIGGAQLKAICEAAKKPTKMRDIMDINGLKFPARVKLNKKPVEKNGNVYWNNELDMVITPDKPHYDEIVRGGEIITDGPVAGGMPENNGGFGNQNIGTTFADPFNGPTDEGGFDYPEPRTDRDQVPF